MSGLIVKTFKKSKSFGDNVIVSPVNVLFAPQRPSLAKKDFLILLTTISLEDSKVTSAEFIANCFNLDLKTTVSLFLIDVSVYESVFFRPIKLSAISTILEKMSLLLSFLLFLLF